ncbi:hypothetical protein [Pseudomonas putida]
MTEDENITSVDLNIDDLTKNFETLYAAVDTEDEMGCVLRFHLMVENLLVFYLKQKCHGEVAVYAKVQREFGQKLGLAAAFGLPLPIAAVIHQINSMRNKLAHGAKTAIDPGDVQQLTRLVNKMSQIDTSLLPPEKAYLESLQKNPGKKMKYGTEGPRVDFLIAGLAFWGSATKVLLEDAALTKVAHSTTTSTRYPSKF